LEEELYGRDAENASRTSAKLKEEKYIVCTLEEELHERNADNQSRTSAKPKEEGELR